MFQLVNDGAGVRRHGAEQHAAASVGAPVVLDFTGAAHAGLTGYGPGQRHRRRRDPAGQGLRDGVEQRPAPGGRAVRSGRIVPARCGAIAVPPTAIRRDASNTAYVLIVDHERIARRDVVTGATDEQASLVQVTSGLEAGETVIVGPASGLEPGQHVTVTGGEG
jgi:hypothetical protein